MYCQPLQISKKGLLSEGLLSVYRFDNVTENNISAEIEIPISVKILFIFIKKQAISYKMILYVENINWV